MPDVARLFGVNRYETSLAICRSNFVSADSVVFATGANFPDALAASGLAGVTGGPVILLPNKDSVPTDVLFELHRLGVKDAYIVGGTGVMHPGIETDLQSAGYAVERLAGPTRYETAKAVADKMVALDGAPDTAFLVSGRSFADALSVSPYAHNQGFPILLTQPTALSAPSETFIVSNSVDDVVIAGGTGVVSSGVASRVDGLRSGAVSVHREGGSDRYATAALVSEYSIDTKGWATWDYLGVATGATFPDALSGGAAAGIRGGGLLLTRPTSLPNITRTTIAANKATMDLTLLFGGSGAVSDGVKSAIESAMN
jgi:cell wall-associated protease